MPKNDVVPSRLMVSAGLVCAVWFSSGQSVAQTTAQAPVQLSPLVVSATTTEQALRDAPATISVITQDELQTRPVQDVSDAVRGMPGLHLNSIGLNRRGISIRGMPAEHTLILVDGKRVNTAASAIAHADYDLTWVPTEAIERIEVVRGPMSSLYGSDALGGVINVITRKATDKWIGSVSAKAGLQQGPGGDMYQAGAYIGGPIVPGLLGMNVYAETRGRDQTADPFDGRLTEQEYRDAETGSIGLTWTPTDTQRIDFTYAHGVEERSYKLLQAGGVPYVYTSTDEVRRRHYAVSYDADWDWGGLNLRAYRSAFDRENIRSRGAPSGPHNFTDDVLDGHVNVPLLDWHLLTFGGDWRREQLEDPTVNLKGNTEIEHKAFFLQDEISLGESWTLLLGNRADEHEKFGWHNSPRAYLVHHVNEALTFKGGVGRGFKAPTLKQLSPEYQAVAAGGRFRILGNPDVKPEISTTYEIGMDYVTKDWTLKAGLFQNDLEDLIQTRCVLACGVFGAERRTYQNLDQARIRGVEVSGSVELPWNLRLEANYTQLAAVDRSTGSELAERPRRTANTALSWFPLDGFMTRLRSEYVGKQATYPVATQKTMLPHYAIWSLDFSQDINDGLVLRGGVQNLTDTRLRDVAQNFTYAEMGRLLWLGVNYSF